MHSIELEIRITGRGVRQFRASVARSVSGAGGDHLFELPEEGETSPGVGDWRDIKRSPSERDKSISRILIDQGRALFQRVFQGDVLIAFDKAYRLARRRGVWFRLQFSFDGAPEAVNLPWEALVGPENNALALLSRISIERRLIKSPAIEVPRLSDRGKIRVLLVGACPEGMAKLDLEQEMDWIQSALHGVGEIRLLAKATESSLSKALAEGPGYDIVHFLGHGDFEGEEGGLWLETETGGGERLTSSELPSTLLRPVSFVFLNVCHGGRASSNPFAGLAEALLRSGARAVIAMRREISDPGAVALAKSFYNQVRKGESLTRAMAKARFEMKNAQGDWAVPMLFLANDDFALRRRPLWPYMALAACVVVATLAWVLWPHPPCARVPPAIPPDARCPALPDLDLPMVYIEAGSFDQGSAKDEDEKPVHEVALTSAFCLGAFEVTQGLYAQVMGLPLPPGLDRYYPVESLTWEESRQLVEKLQARFPEAGFRVPTEAEWEYAARAGRPGDEDEPSPANCLGRRAKDSCQGVSSVGSFPPNAWGLYDTKGNVWEWVEDWYAPYTKDSWTDPRGPETGEKKVRRGGSYKNNAKNCRFSTRAGVQPDREQEAAGVRIARSPAMIQE